MTPVSETSVPFNSASLLSLIPIVFFINAQTIKATAKTNTFMEITPRHGVPTFAPELVIGTAKVPHIPANKCAGTAPTTSSIFQ